MMIEKSGTIRLKDIHIPQGGTPEQQELAQGMVRVNHLYRSALKVAVTQLEILDDGGPGDRDRVHAEVEGLPRQQFDLSSAGAQADHLEPVRSGGNHLQRLRTDGAGAAQNHHVAHRDSLAGHRIWSHPLRSA